MPAEKRAMTQRSLASLAGVSVATVSRVLGAAEDDRLRWASPATVERILSLAEEHGYRRNPHAASLRTSRSNLVGVIVPRLQDFVLATIYEGIDEAATEQSITTYVTNSMDDPELRAVRTRSMLDRRVDGFIFGDARLDEPFLDDLAEQEVPFVLTSRRRGKHLAITCDDYAGGKLVAEHLVSLGRSQVAILGGLEFASTAKDRTAGVLEGLAEEGISVPGDHVLFRGFDTAAGRAAMQELLEGGFRPDAVFATNDFAAIGALGVLQDYGLRVPEDVALVGYNDTPLAASVGIPLTSVRSPMHEMGRRAFQVLQQVMAGQDAVSERLAPELVVRASTCPEPSPPLSRG